MARRPYGFQGMQTMHFLSNLDSAVSGKIKQLIFTDAIKLCNRMAYEQFIQEPRHLAHIEEFVVRYSVLYAQYLQSTILDYICAYLHDYLHAYNLQGNSVEYTDILISYIQEITQRVGSLPKD